ncbi:MAG: thioredoxin domain-containing protein [Gemmatimonadales bacterium]|nr:thioredoxin domain-containing protein [Gemmatimonadales bacterium]
MSKFLSNAVSAILPICAIVITGLVVRRELFPPSASAEPEIRKISDWKPLFEGGSVMGPIGAPIRILVFSDFQCPFCAEANTSLARLRAAFPGQVAVIHRHFPLESIHPYARAAARAAECAGAQGRFEVYQDALFAAQASLPSQPWDSLARVSAVPDSAAFARCHAASLFDERITRDLKLGRAIGVNGTPTFIFDGKMVAGAPAVQLIEKWVRATMGGN